MTKKKKGEKLWGVGTSIFSPPKLHPSEIFKKKTHKQTQKHFSNQLFTRFWRSFATTL
jgi:hypothetical protein